METMTATPDTRSPQRKGQKHRFRVNGLYTGPDESVTRYRVPARIPRSATLAGKPFDEQNLATNDVLPDELTARCSPAELAAMAAFHPDKDYRHGSVVETERDLHGEFDAPGMTGKFIPIGHEVTADSEVWDKRHETLEQFIGRMRAKGAVPPSGLDVSDISAGHEQRPAPSIGGQPPKHPQQRR